MKVVADFWEDHCVECGEPACFKSCPKFRRGTHGRCERVVLGKKGQLTFLPWGKLELLWHGRTAKHETASRLKSWNARWERVAKALQCVFGWLPVPYGRGPYGIFRSVRWRRAMRQAEYAEQPDRWRLEVSSDKTVKLMFEVKDSDGNILLAKVADAGIHAKAYEFHVPRIKAGALFSIRPVDSNATCGVAISKNELVREDAKLIKCVAWDLDDTLWDGILSEGDEVRLNTALLDVVKELDRRGVVSSIASKNYEDAAIAKLKAFGIEEWFVFPQINWGPKSESLKNLASAMNIGLDAIAFVDDREENRREVAANLPEVRVFCETDLPDMLARLEKDGLIPPVGAGNLGSERRRMYRDEMVRRKAAEAFSGDPKAFYASSGLDFELLPVESERKTRCLELVQRTNQLNLTARRYDEAGFDELLAASECRAVRVWDRYGDYGIVGFVAWQGSHLKECCFSCRIARRGVERKVLDRISSGRRFTADVVASDRNKPIRDIVEDWLDA